MSISLMVSLGCSKLGILNLAWMSLNEMLKDTAKFHGYNFPRWWVINGKSTGK